MCPNFADSSFICSYCEGKPYSGGCYSRVGQVLLSGRNLHAASWFTCWIVCMSTILAASSLFTFYFSFIFQLASKPFLYIYLPKFPFWGSNTRNARTVYTANTFYYHYIRSLLHFENSFWHEVRNSAILAWLPGQLRDTYVNRWKLLDLSNSNGYCS